MWGCAILGGRRGEGGRSSAAVTRLGWCLWREPGNLPVVYLVTQDGIWGTGSDDVGFIQSTKAPKHLERVEVKREDIFAPPRAQPRHLAQRVLQGGKVTKYQAS